MTTDIPAASTTNPVRMAMIGGGPGAFIGPVHAMAARLDGRIRMVAGAFSSDPDRSLSGGRAQGLPDERIYSDWRKLIAEEAKRPDGAEFVAIVTPNHLHQPLAIAALEAGLHVISDKPAASNLAEALMLENAVARTGGHYALTYTYTGYPMIRHARALVAQGAIGRVRKVAVQYIQGWLAEPAEHGGNKQAHWRVDPRQAGVGGCIGDIGVHAFNLAEFVSGERVVEIMPDLSSVVGGRTLDDDCNILMRFAGGQPGVLVASQICTGERNDLTLKVHGTAATLSWSHEDCGTLRIDHADGRTEILRAGQGAVPGTRLPIGHPEGFIEAFANIYTDFATIVRGGAGAAGGLVPGIEEGVRSMRFVELAVTASRARDSWVILAD
ncbi:Gfo/Idh/MocA family protein [Novosphingobium sp. PY1]|uniref:Gfo/Idh/MocA family protein n=1 Tax=Novosphingobium sp. PY1 TaxID=1882221 RepID=UPI000BE77AF0|nr:Gfo/Idh/MocA family oxidoreductase [Novosphingobium sp. PY1]BBA74023.1 oxidoreductase domain protein [Novosphingobium sp. PY1]GFM31260.1 oxidoreductase domain protein [Novosphingobium sp. PY1]